MKARGAAIQGALALVGLSAAYATWQREPERAPGEVTVLDAGKNDLSSLRFEGDRGWVELRREAGGEGAVWIELAARPEEKRPERELLGNEQAGRVLDGFAPLRATRALGAVDPSKLVEFGLASSPAAAAPAAAPAASIDGGVAKEKPPEKKPENKPENKIEHIEARVKGELRRFTVGKPPGSFSPYLQDERDQKVYLLGGSLISDLESAASRMVDRTLHAFKAGEYDAVTITSPVGGAKKRELIVTNPEQPATSKLAPRKSPDKPDELARNWHDKVWRAIAVEVLGKGETPASGSPQLALRVDYGWKGASKGFVEIGRVPVAAPAPAGPGGVTPPPLPPELYARTEHTAGWVKLTASIEELVKEGEKIAATE